MKTLILLLALLVPAISFGQTNYSIGWHKIAGGGGVSTNGSFTLTGTIGQADAAGQLTGTNYTLSGGFWALVSVVQTPGLPDLAITHSGSTVSVSWPDTAVYTLQQNVNLVSGVWSNSNYSVSTNNGTNSVTISPPTGNLFFRLMQ